MGYRIKKENPSFPFFYFTRTTLEQQILPQTNIKECLLSNLHKFSFEQVRYDSKEPLVQKGRSIGAMALNRVYFVKGRHFSIKDYIWEI